MNLIVDLGNTRTKISVTSEGTIIFQQATEDEEIIVLGKVLKSYHGLSRAIVSSVRNESRSILEMLKAKLPEVLELSHDTRIPLRIDYRNPQTLGMDRIAAAVGAWGLFPGCELLVIDAGTAITTDRVTCDGIFTGGKISPGMQVRFRALHAFTGRLPMVEKTEQWVYPGKDTNECITTGVLEGILMEMEETIRHQSNQIDNLHVVLTGGDSDFFARNLKSPIFVNSNLNTIGLDKILEYNT